MYLLSAPTLIFHTKSLEPIIFNISVSYVNNLVVCGDKIRKRMVKSHKCTKYINMTIVLSSSDRHIDRYLTQ